MDQNIKSAIHYIVRITKGRWEDMLKIVVNKYNNTIHSSTKFKSTDAHDDNKLSGGSNAVNSQLDK